MLRRLTLKDFVIVRELDVELGAGFTALTGETGAGKSILIDALQLALGNRADAGVVREGAARADITAEFEPSPAVAARLRPWLEEAGFESPDDTGPASLMLRRVVDAQGKSRAWINGASATVTQLRELGSQLVDIHGQHAWQSLTRPEATRALLDAQAGVDEAALAAAWQARKDARRRLEEARQRQSGLDQERDRLQWQIGELDKLRPLPGEWPELNAEHQRLAHGQAILDAANSALQLVSEADDSADTLTCRAIVALESVAEVEPRLHDALTVLRGAQAQLQDAAHSLGAALRHTELDPDRLATLDQRLADWLGLARRFRQSPEALVDLLSGWKAELAELDAAADLDALTREAEAAHQRWQTVAQAVSRQRAAAAPKLARAITEAMQTLGMDGGRFQIDLPAAAEPLPHGLEQVDFLVAGHAGSTPRPLGKVASGGELSRLALAIAVTTTRQAEAGAQVDTLLFDEIDAGVGGQVADAVGRLMQQLGHERQVMAVTHLAQVAACAHAQLVVSKSVEGGQTVSQIAPVTGAEREQEIARMLGGALKDTSLAHARAMLSQAHATPAQAPSPAGAKAGRPRKEPA